VPLLLALGGVWTRARKEEEEKKEEEEEEEGWG